MSFHQDEFHDYKLEQSSKRTELQKFSIDLIMLLQKYDHLEDVYPLTQLIVMAIALSDRNNYIKIQRSLKDAELYLPPRIVKETLDAMSKIRKSGKFDHGKSGGRLV